MGWFRSNRASADDVAELRAQLAELTARLDTSSEPPDAPAPNAPAPPAPTPPPPDAPRLESLVERLDALELRISSVATELANQLSELSGELDDDERVSTVESTLTTRLEQAVSDIRATTEALAAEQARYEIQFRADLAEVADRSRRDPAER